MLNKKRTGHSLDPFSLSLTMTRVLTHVARFYYVLFTLLQRLTVRTFKYYEFLLIWALRSGSGSTESASRLDPSGSSKKGLDGSSNRDQMRKSEPPWPMFTARARAVRPTGHGHQAKEKNAVDCDEEWDTTLKENQSLFDPLLIEPECTGGKREVFTIATKILGTSGIHEVRLRL